MSSGRGENEPLTGSDYRLLADFRFLLRSFQAFSEDAARAAGLTAQQHQALLAIAGAGDAEWLSVGELGARLHVEAHSAVGLVNRLEAEGLVERVRDPADHRRVRVRPTARGWSKLEELSAAHREEIGRIAPDLMALLKELASHDERR